ncbi:MAG: hypothetical protein KDA78_02565 [Planctomycetaceae bacterium]|nr:hypothetical protein [Planctomycetaceae bacterium]
MRPRHSSDDFSESQFFEQGQLVPRRRPLLSIIILGLAATSLLSWKLYASNSFSFDFDISPSKPEVLEEWIPSLNGVFEVFPAENPSELIARGISGQVFKIDLRTGHVSRDRKTQRTNAVQILCEYKHNLVAVGNSETEEFQVTFDLAKNMTRVAVPIQMEVSAAEIIDDGKKIVVALMDFVSRKNGQEENYLLVTLDLVSGQVLETITTPDIVFSICYDQATGELFASQYPGILRWIPGKSKPKSIPVKEVRKLQLLPGKRMLIAGDFHGKITAYSLDTFQKIWVTKADRKLTVKTLAVDPDENCIAIGGDSPLLLLLHTETGRTLFCTPPGKAGINGLSFSDSGELLFVSRANAHIETWQMEGYHLLTDFGI